MATIEDVLAELHPVGLNNQRFDPLDDSFSARAYDAYQDLKEESNRNPEKARRIFDYWLQESRDQLKSIGFEEWQPSEEELTREISIADILKTHDRTESIRLRHLRLLALRRALG